ncbi:glycosyltransferase [Sphingobacterium cellulitidis]|uniref:glycosyltransferase n=1 Tax=Sphingobacterium cellulitidis TaxID=1768011 RepID=UPI00370DBDEA
MKVALVINNLNFGGAEKLLAESIPVYKLFKIKPNVILLNDTETELTVEVKKETDLISLSKGSPYNPLIIFQLVSELNKYDLIHFHLFPTLYWVVIASLFTKSRVKLVYTEHSTENKRRNNIILKFLDRLIYKRIDKIITISEAVDEKLKNHLHLSNEKFSLIKNGINLKKFNSAKPYNKSVFFTEKDTILVQVSSFRYPKDQKTIIKALSSLEENICLLLVGEGPLKEDCRKLVVNLKLDHRVKFLGIRNDVPNILKTADIIILSSEYEGLSLSSIEGMCLNKPFIASSVPGLKEVVEGAGLLFQFGNVNELISHIKLILNDKILYAKVSEQCLKRSKEFDIKKMVYNYILVYEDLFKKGKKL